MRSHYFLSFLFLVFLSASTSALASKARSGSGRSLLGGWKNITNINDPYITGIAEFAVAEHNNNPEKKGNLKLVKVIKGLYQVVAGTNYFLELSAKLPGSHVTNNYVAFAFDKAWENQRNLVVFMHVL